MSVTPGNPPLISVIMACYNAEAFLAEAIDCVLNQDYTNVELIVVDDGSSDGSADILSGYEGRIRVLRQANQGPYPARNNGIAACHGDMVAFLDADDYWEQDFLSAMYAELEAREADLSYCGWQNIGSDHSANQPYIPPKYEDGDLARQFLKGSPWPIHAALMRKSLLDAINGFSTRHFASMDYDLWIRMLAVTGKFARVDRVLAYYRWHGEGQISSNRWKQTMSAWHVRRDFVSANPGLVSHIAADERRQLIDGPILRMAYQTYWKRDLASAQKLFRKALVTGIWKLADLKYILPSLLPGPVYRGMLGARDQSRQPGQG